MAVRNLRFLMSRSLMQALVSPRTLFLDAIKNRRFLRFGCSRNNSSLKAGVLVKFLDIKWPRGDLNPRHLDFLRNLRFVKDEVLEHAQESLIPDVLWVNFPQENALCPRGGFIRVT